MTGVRWMDHAAPSQCWISGALPTLPLPCPVPKLSVAVGQATPHRKLWVGEAGAGVFSMDHEVPFQACASGVWFCQREVWLPTAVQKDADRHDTADRPARGAGGFGVAWMDHETPFHRSARVTWACLPDWYWCAPF